MRNQNKKFEKSEQKKGHFRAKNRKTPILQFAHFFVKKVTKVIFQPSKFGDIFDQGCPSSQISHERARIANMLNNRVFDGFPVKSEQKNLKNEH